MPSVCMCSCRVCVRAQKTGAVARESLRRDRHGGFILPAFHARGSNAAPVRTFAAVPERERVDDDAVSEYDEVDASLRRWFLEELR